MLIAWFYGEVSSTAEIPFYPYIYLVSVGLFMLSVLMIKLVRFVKRRPKYESSLVGLIGIIVFFLLLVLRMPIAYAMSLVGFIGFSCLVSTEAFLESWPRISFPLFPLIRWV